MNRFALMIGTAVMSCTLLAGCGGNQHMPVQTSGGPPPRRRLLRRPRTCDTAAMYWPLCRRRPRRRRIRLKWTTPRLQRSTLSMGDETSSPISAVDAT